MIGIRAKRGVSKDARSMAGSDGGRSLWADAPAAIASNILQPIDRSPLTGLRESTLSLFSRYDECYSRVLRK
jgi:hypothetical protein